MVVVPDGGGEPGAYPNTSVTGANLIVRGGATFDSNAEVTAFDGQGPIAWSINRYNRGDFSMRLSPADPTAAANGTLNQGYIEFADTSPGLAASLAWRPTPVRGVILPTARQNGPIDWSDGEGPFFPTVAVSESSSGPGYDMLTGQFANGDLDINTGRAGTHASSPEGNFAFSVTWFPYDQGWLGGEAAGPLTGDPVLPDGTARWTRPNAHAAGLSAGLVQWLDFPDGSGQFGGRARLHLPGVNSLEDGMLFCTSSDGGSDVNIAGVAPESDGNGWLVTLREDAATDAESLAGADQSEFQFVYVPYTSARLVGGYISGADGSKTKAVGDFTVNRTAAGTYEITIPGKTGSSGALLLQAAGLESGALEPLATRAFLSYEFAGGKFTVQSRATTSDTEADLRDSDFYVAWIDFTEPLSPPEGPRLRSLDPVVVTGEGISSKEAGVAANTLEPEVLVTTIDSANTAGLTDPITGQVALAALIGRFYDPRTLTPTSDPFIIVGNPVGDITRHDVKFNPVSKQYVVVANARASSPAGLDVPLIALVKTATDAGTGSPVAKAFVYDEDTSYSYDDVAVAVSTKNGNFLMVAEYKFPDEGEGVVGALFSSTGDLLSTGENRLDLLQSVGDEDDPDVTYLPAEDAFLYIVNTDNSNGSTGPYGNRIVGAVVDTLPDGQGNLVTRTEQPLADGQPAGTAEGHPAALENPFNGQVITAFDAGNGTANGTLSYLSIGPAPTYTFTPAGPEVPYLDGTSGDPFNHQHPQLAADPDHGVIVVGFNATGSTVGNPEAYAVTLLGPDGQPLPSQLGAPYLLADAPGGISNSANDHNIKYSPATGSFVVAYAGTNPAVTYLAALEVTASATTPGGEVAVSIRTVANNLEVSWPADATDYVLQSSAALGPNSSWTAVSATPTQSGGTNTVGVTPTGSAQFYRLAKP